MSRLKVVKTLERILKKVYTFWGILWVSAGGYRRFGDTARLPSISNSTG